MAIRLIQANFGEPAFNGLIGPFPSDEAAERFMKEMREIVLSAGGSWSGNWNLTDVRSPTSLRVFLEGLPIRDLGHATSIDGQLHHDTENKGGYSMHIDPTDGKRI